MGCQNGKSSARGKNLKVKGNSTGNKLNECKIVFLGDSGVGKSSISQRFCKDIFNENYEVTIGGAYLQYQIQLKNNVTLLKMHLWDTGGEERFRAMAPLYYRDANGAVLVYDVSDPKSYKSIEYWQKELDSLVKQEGLVIALAGNKCDLGNKSVSFESAKSYAVENKMICYETSAKTGEGIKELFRDLAEEIYEKMVEHKKL